MDNNGGDKRGKSRNETLILFSLLLRGAHMIVNRWKIILLKIFTGFILYTWFDRLLKNSWTKFLLKRWLDYSIKITISFYFFFIVYCIVKFHWFLINFFWDIDTCLIFFLFKLKLFQIIIIIIKKGIKNLSKHWQHFILLDDQCFHVLPTFLKKSK